MCDKFQQVTNVQVFYHIFRWACTYKPLFICVSVPKNVCFSFPPYVCSKILLVMMICESLCPPPLAFFFVIGHMIVTIMITCLRLTKSWTSLGWAWPSSGHLGYEFKQLLSSTWFKLLFVNQIKRDNFFMLIYRLIFKFINRINHLQSTGQSKSG